MVALSYAERAKAALPAGLWAYLEGGAEAEAALRRNRRALDDLALVPRLLVDVSQVDPSTSFLGSHLALPLLLAPVGSLHRLHEEGVEGLGTAAERAGIAWSAGSALPNAAGLDVSSTGSAFYQIYIEGDGDWLARQCRDAIARGYRAVIITADAPVFPARRRDLETGNHASDRRWDGTSIFRKTFTWDGLAALIERNRDIPIILKGVQDPRDALRACEAGVVAVYLSNHGGRQFDQGCGAVELIAPVAEALDRRIPLIVDGGFHSGADVLKALALGADIVGLGRACLYPYAAEGPTGLSAFLSDLGEQIRTNMTLLGAPRLAHLRELSVRTSPRGAVNPHRRRSYPWNVSMQHSSSC